MYRFITLKMRLVVALTTVAIVVPLLVSWTYYMHFENHLKIFVSKQSEKNCLGHVQLCWLRHVIETTRGIPLFGDVFDLTPLKQFKTRVYLDYAIFHDSGQKWTYRQTVLEANTILQYARDEALLNGATYKILVKTNATDIFLRGCNFNPHNEYMYQYSVSIVGNNAHVYVYESIKKGTCKVMNFIYGKVETKNTLTACTLVDTLCKDSTNSYMFICQITENKFVITLSATYISISTSKFKCKGNHLWYLRTFKEDSILRKTAESGVGLDLNVAKRTECTSSIRHKGGFWLKIDGNHHWTTESCHFPFTFATSQQQCLHQKQIIMIGDSHMRQRYAGIKDAYSMTNLYLLKARHSINVLCILFDLYKGMQNGSISADVLIINAGNHDLSLLNIEIYLATMSDILTILKLILHLTTPPQIIWIETLPTPFDGFHKRMMTNQAVEACNDWINHKMRQLGIYVIKAFTIALSVTSQSTDGTHYPAQFGKNIKKLKGINVEGGIISLIGLAICPKSQ